MKKKPVGPAPGTRYKNDLSMVIVLALVLIVSFTLVSFRIGQIESTQEVSDWQVIEASCLCQVLGASVKEMTVHDGRISFTCSGSFGPITMKKGLKLPEGAVRCATHFVSYCSLRPLDCFVKDR